MNEFAHIAVEAVSSLSDWPGMYTILLQKEVQTLTKFLEVCPIRMNLKGKTALLNATNHPYFVTEVTESELVTSRMVTNNESHCSYRFKNDQRQFVHNCDEFDNMQL